MNLVKKVPAALLVLMVLTVLALPAYAAGESTLTQDTQVVESQESEDLSVGLKAVAAEVELSSTFRRKKIYTFFMKYLAPAFLIVILLSSIADVLGWISL